MDERTMHLESAREAMAKARTGEPYGSRQEVTERHRARRLWAAVAAQQIGAAAHLSNLKTLTVRSEVSFWEQLFRLTLPLASEKPTDLLALQTLFDDVAECDAA